MMPAAFTTESMSQFKNLSYKLALKISAYLAVCQ